MRSLRRTITILFTIIIVILLILQSVGYYYTTRSSSRLRIMNMALELVESKGEYLNYTFIQDVERINAAALTYCLSDNIRDRREYIDKLNSNLHGNIKCFWTVDQNMDYYSSQKPIDKQLLNDDVRRVLSGEADYIISDAFRQEENGPVLTYKIVPIKEDGRITGAMGSFHDTSISMTSLSQVSLDGIGEALLVDSSGNIVTSREEDRILKYNVADFESLGYKGFKDPKTLADKDGNLSYKDKQGREKILIYSKIKYTPNWYLFMVMSEQEISSYLSKAIYQTIILGIGFGLVSLLAIFIVSKKIVDPIEIVEKEAKELSSLNATYEIPKKYLKRRDEIGSLFNSMSLMTERLREFMQDNRVSADELYQDAQELDITSEKLLASTRDIAAFSEEVALNSEYQQEEANDLIRSVADLEKLFETQAKGVSTVMKNDESIISSKIVGRKAIETLKEDMERTIDLAKEAKNSLYKTVESTDSIKKASSIINEIAGQTNLLALNAAIQAASVEDNSGAGDSGAGFSVVAEEIRVLAEESRSFTNEIESIVEGLNKNAGETVNMIEEVLASIDNLEEDIYVADENFEYIAISIRESMISMDDLNDSTKLLSKERLELMDRISKFIDSANENANAMQSTTNLLVEQNALVEDVFKVSHTLTDYSELLRDELKRFKV